MPAAGPAAYDTQRKIFHAATVTANVPGQLTDVGCKKGKEPADREIVRWINWSVFPPAHEPALYTWTGE